MNTRFTTGLRHLLLIASIICSPAVRAADATLEDVLAIARLYSAAFDRNPRVGGLNFWVNTFESGSSIEAIAQRFYDSPEFVERYGDLQNRGFVELLFRNVLGRDGNPGGIDFWAGHLEDGVPRANVLSNFASSPENVAKTAAIFRNMRLSDGSWVFAGFPNPFARRSCETALEDVAASCIHAQLDGSIGGSNVTVALLRSPAFALASAVSLSAEDLLSELLQDGLGSQLDVDSTEDLFDLLLSGGLDGVLDPEVDLDRLLLAGVAELVPGGLNTDALYLLTASGGSESGAEFGTGRTTISADVQGSWHAIASGQRIIDGGIEISALSEALYQQLQARLGDWDDAEVLARLQAAATLVVGDVDGSGKVDYDDVLRWNRGLDGDFYLADLADVDDLAAAITAGQSGGMLVGEARAVLGGQRVLLEFDAGTVMAETLNWDSPITAANFLAYVRAGFYTPMVVHRAISDFMIQMGLLEFVGLDASGLVLFEEKAPLFSPVVNESSNGLSNTRGMLSMARLNDPDSAAAQFFINQVDNTHLDFDSASAAQGYAVFARVLSGMEVVDDIAAEPTTTLSSAKLSSTLRDVPARGVILESVTIAP